MKSRPDFLADVPACDPRRVRVAVLMGGVGSEREVSLMSGREVGRALREAGFPVQEIDLKPQDVASLAGPDFDLAFIALHGPFGEGGALQDQLEAMGILYVGSGGQASRQAMDKVAAKELFVAAGLPTPPWQVVAQGDDDAAEEAYQALGPDVVVKPIDDGSSVAVTLVGDRQRYAEGLAEVFALHDKALVERQVFGRELTV
ncbi:MAG: D-alanine--D-alanine ligase, partial [Anaerolineaceae bacterium]|nr:D-alanine--D-alanine ligase [Anaerolineaceae bacterium]